MSEGLNMIHDTLDNFSGKKVPELNWHGWTPDNGMTATEYFKAFEPDCWCKADCKNCGYFFMSSEGGELNKTENGEFTKNDTPLCGKW